MPDSGGVYTRSDGTRTGPTVCQQEQASSIGNTAALADAREQDMATALNNRIFKDGTNTPTANLPMNSFKHTGVAAATGAGQYMEYAQIVAGYQPLDTNLTGLSAGSGTPLLSKSGAIALDLRRTENDTSEHTVLSQQVADGSGNDFSYRVVGDGSKNVATVRRYIGSTKIEEDTTTSKVLPFPVDLAEISTPSPPASGNLRVYSKANDHLAVQGSGGIERLIGVGLPGANVVTITNNAGTPNTKADVTVSGLAILVNANGQVAFVNAPGLITVNLATTGAGGMDTGTQPTTAAVYFYGIYNASTATWSVIGSATSPSGGGSSNLPSGYTFTVYLGSMMNDSNPHLRPTYQTGKRVTYTTPPAISGTVTYANFFPAYSEAALLTATTSTIANDTWSVTDMNGNTVASQGALPSGSGEAILSTVTVPNTGGTTFGTGGTGSSFTAYGWIERANVT
jgi:hypothetical protein